MAYTRYGQEELMLMSPENLVERLILAARLVGETDDGYSRPEDYTYEASGREILQLQEEVLRRLRANSQQRNHGAPNLTDPNESRSVNGIPFMTETDDHPFDPSILHSATHGATHLYHTL